MKMLQGHFTHTHTHTHLSQEQMDNNAAIMFEVHEAVVGYSIKTIKRDRFRIGCVNITRKFIMFLICCT